MTSGVRRSDMKITVLRYAVCIVAYVSSLLAIWFVPTTQIIHYGATPDHEIFSLAQIDDNFLRTAVPARGILWDTIAVRFLWIWAATGIGFICLSVLQKRMRRRRDGEQGAAANPRQSSGR